MTTKITYQHAFYLLKMKKSQSRNENIDLAKETNLLWIQIVRKARYSDLIACRI
tara:strand:+ start:804 stop:965 length:162 start_codon:yes stop_codon:yes gene_type:complete